MFWKRICSGPWHCVNRGADTGRESRRGADVAAEKTPMLKRRPPHAHHLRGLFSASRRQHHTTASWLHSVKGKEKRKVLEGKKEAAIGLWGGGRYSVSALICFKRGSWRWADNGHLARIVRSPRTSLLTPSLSLLSALLRSFTPCRGFATAATGLSQVVGIMESIRGYRQPVNKTKEKNKSFSRMTIGCETGMRCVSFRKKIFNPISCHLDKT